MRVGSRTTRTACARTASRGSRHVHHGQPVHQKPGQVVLSVPFGARLLAGCPLAEPVPTPEVRREGDDLIFVWDSLSVQATVSDITSGRDGPRAEVRARHLISGHLHAAMVNLLSTTSKLTFTKAVLARDPQNNWADLVEQFSVIATEAHREGEPLELLEPRRRPEAGRFAVDPIVPLKGTTLLAGDGKTLKSYTAIGMCRAMMLGVPFAGMPTTKLVPGYLDYETDKEEPEDRLLRLGGDVAFFYRRCTVPLHEQAKAIKRELDRNGVEFIVIDSLGLACGGDPSSPEIALGMFSTIRFLDRPAAIVHHSPKGRPAESFGSAYIRNSSRSAWFFLRSASPEERTATVALQHAWTNTGRLQRPIGLEFTFDDEAYTTTVRRTDPGPILQLAGSMTKKDAIIAFLQEAPGAEVQDIATALGEDAGKVSVHLSQLKKQGRVSNRQREWALCSERET